MGGNTRLLTALQKVMRYEMTITEWVGAAILLGTPYLTIGIIWSVINTDHLRQLDGVDLAVSFLGSVVSWPVLLISACA
jgi:hypothetical protein